MKRRTLLRLAATGALLLGGPLSPESSANPAGAVPVMKRRRLRPTDPGWPSAAAWDRLKAAVGGRLTKVESPLAACAGDPGPLACQQLLRNLQNPFFIGDQPWATLRRRDHRGRALCPRWRVHDSWRRRADPERRLRQFFSKYYGTAAASLLEAEVITADGQVRVANACTNPSLFWALKGGGGGSFGVVTRLTLKAHKLADRAGAAIFTVKAMSGVAFRDMIRKVVGVYAERLCNPHSGKSVVCATMPIRLNRGRGTLVVRCQQMIPIRWLNRTTTILILWSDSRSPWETKRFDRTTSVCAVERGECRGS
jgi:hypothetical protein